jgi:hypothetical protein
MRCRFAFANSRGTVNEPLVKERKRFANSSSGMYKPKNKAIKNERVRRLPF